MIRIRPFALGLLAAQALFSGSVWAASQSLTANIRFDLPLSVTKESDISFGTVLAERSGTYTIAPGGGVTADNGGQVLGGTTSAGSLTISGSATQSIDISAANYTADSGVTPSAATCSYDGGAAAPCSLTTQTAPATGKTLLVGATVAVDGTQDVGTSAAPKFDVIVNYH